MSVATVRARLVEICQLVSGINNAYGAVPRNITADNLPAFVILAGPAVDSWLGNDLKRVTRTYTLALLVKPWVQGIDLEAEQECEPFFDSVRAIFDARPGLHTADNTDPLKGVQNSALTGDAGVTEIILAGPSYAGITFNLDVEEEIRVEQGS